MDYCATCEAVIGATIGSAFMALGGLPPWTFVVYWIVCLGVGVYADIDRYVRKKRD